jgi:hypothetical protein
MRTFKLRTYGALDFEVTAKSLRAAKVKLARSFAPDLPVDPLTNRVITDRITTLGYYILMPKDTKEIVI